MAMNVVDVKNAARLIKDYCKTGTCADNLLDEYEKKQKGGTT